MSFSPQSILDDVNAKVDGIKLAQALEYFPERIQPDKSGETLKCCCPLHSEPNVMRSLVIDMKARTFKCRNKKCSGGAGGTYVELWGKLKEKEGIEAALDLAEKLKLDIDVEKLRGMGSEMLKKAQAAMEAKDFTQAREAADQALPFLPGDVGALNLSAEIYQASGNHDRANEEYLQLIDLCLEKREFPTIRQLLPHLLNDNSRNIDFAQRRVALEKAESKEEGLRSALIALAELHSEAGNDAEEKSALQELNGVVGEDVSVLERMADLHEKAQRSAELIENLQSLTVLFESKERWEQLFTTLQRHEAVVPDDLDVREKAAETILKLGDGAVEPTRVSDRIFNLAGSFKDNGKLEKARNLMNRLVEAQPENTKAIGQLAAWSHELGDDERAVELYRKLAEQAREAGNTKESIQFLNLAKGVNPEDYALRRDLAEIQLEQGQVDAGVAELFELAKIYLAESDPEPGFKILARISEAVPDDLQRSIEIARVLEEAGHRDQALKAHLDVIARLQSAGSHEDALTVCQEAKRLDPRNAALFDLHLKSNLELGRKSEAIEACRDIARAFQSDSDLETAEAFLLKGIEIEPTAPDIKQDLALLLEKAGRNEEAAKRWIEVAATHQADSNTEKAIAAAREALRLDPESNEARGLVADALAAQGDVGEAVKMWKAASESHLAKDPQSPDALEILHHALEFAPDDLEILAGAAQLQFQIEGADKARDAFEGWVEKTIQAAVAPDSIKTLSKAVECYPKDLAWRSSLANLLIDQGAPQAALPHLEALLVSYRGAGAEGPDYARVLEMMVQITPDRHDLRGEWAEALAKSGDEERAHALFAEVIEHFLAKKDEESALEIIQKALQYQPDDHDLQSQFAELAAKHKDKLAEAIKTYEGMIEKNAKAGKLAENVPILEKLIVLCPERLQLREALIDIHEKEGESDKAADQCRRLADLHTGADRAAEAEAFLARAVKIQPDNDTLLGLLADSQISQNRVEEAAQTLKLLIDHFRERGEYEPAVERARQIVDLQSSSLDSRELLGSVLFDADHHEEAVETWRSMGEELAEAGDLDSAAERFDQILKHAERDVAALRSAADLTRKARGDEAALAPYERLLEVVIADGTPQEVEKEFERLLEGNDKESILHLRMGEKYGSYLHSAGKTEEAAEQFLGISKIMLGPRDDAEGALRVVRTLRELDPANPSALDEEATILAKMGETEKAGAVLLDLAEAHRDYAEEDRAAEVLLRRADLLPDDVAAQVAAGEAFEALDDADRAKTLYFRGIEIHDRRREPAPCIPLFKKVLNLNPPERMKIEVVLGQAYAQAGQTEEAVEQLLLVGAKYEESSEQDNAARLYRRIKRISPEALEPRWRLVRYAESKQDNAAALKELRQMSTISVTSDDPEQSISILQLILKLDPKDLNSRVALAGSFRKSGQDSELFEALGSLEQLYRESGEIDLAITILEELRTLRPDDLDIVHRSFELRIKKHEVPEAVGIAFELIESYLRNQRTDDAVAMMRRIVELDPKDVTRRVSLARLVESEGHPEIALEELRKGWEELFNKNLDEECLKLCEDAQEFFPDEIILRKCLVETLRRKGPMERAVQERISLAELLESKGEVQDAFQTLEEILADHPDYFAAHQVIVELAERSGEVEKAVEHLALLADIHFKARKLPDAIKALERAVELAPGRGEFQIQLAELNHETGAGERARDLWMNAAQNLRSSDKVQEAIRIYEKVRTLYPGAVEPLVPLVDCYREAGDDDLYLGRGVQLGKVYLDGEAFSDAIGVYEALGERFGKNPEVWDALAESYEKSGDMDGAVRCWKHLAELHEAEKRNKRAKDYLERALKAVAADVEILRLLGELCLRLKQKDEGLKHLSDAASSLQESGKLDEARAIVDVILKEDPKNNRLLRLRGSLQEDLGDMAAAVKDYAEAAGGAAEAGDRAFAIELFSHLLELDPSRNQDREAYARALEREGQTEEACQQYVALVQGLPADDDRLRQRYCNLILKLNPDHPEAHIELCKLYERTKKPSLAIKECQWLSAHYLSSGQKAEAEQYMRLGLDQSPEDLDLRRQLVELLIESGRKEEAAAGLDEISKLAKNDPATERWALEQACELQPENTDYRNQYAEKLDQSGKRGEARTIRVQVMEILLDRGDMDEARQMGEQVTKSAPDDEVLRRRIADIFEKAGLPELAAFHHAFLAKAALQAGRHDDVREITAHILKIKPRHVAARELLREALTAQGDSAAACEQSRQLYKLHIEAEDYEDAGNEAKFLIKQNPQDAEPLRWLIDVYRKTDRPEPMIAQMRSLTELLAASGDIQAALGTLKDILEAEPEDTQARIRYIDLYTQVGDESELFDEYLLLATSYHKSGDVKEASRTFVRIVDTFPDRPDGREQFITFLFDQKQIDRAVAQSRQLADLYLKSEQVAEAGKLVERALAEAPKDLELRQLLATLQIRTNRRGQALKTLQELLEIYNKSEDKEKQTDILSQIVEVDAQDIDQRQKLAELCTELGQNEKAKEHRLALADQYAGREIHDLAEREYRLVLDLDPADEDVWTKLIEMHRKIASPEDVYLDLTALAHLHVAEGRLKDAVSIYREALEINRDDAEILHEYIKTYAQIGNEADLVDDYLHLADLYNRMGKVAEAGKIYDLVETMDPEQGKAKRKEAEAGAAKQPPESDGTEKPKGALQPKSEQAIGNFQKVLKLNPDNPEVRSKLADVLAKAGRTEEADKEWVKAGEDYFRRGRLNQCIDIFEDLIKRHASDARIRQGLQKAILKRDSLKALGTEMA